MNDTTRAGHMAWCKQRALEYVDAGDWVGATASMLSDLGKHPGTKGVVEQFGGMLILTVHDTASARRFVEGFN